MAKKLNNSITVTAFDYFLRQWRKNAFIVSVFHNIIMIIKIY